MPGFDKTGPEGEGPQTGRGLGRCDDDEPPRRGLGRGRGFGRARGRKRPANRRRLRRLRALLSKDVLPEEK